MSDEDNRYAQYSQGIAFDGPVILRDGIPMTPDEIVKELNELAEYRWMYLDLCE
jgi:hypothetical protein